MTAMFEAITDEAEIAETLNGRVAKGFADKFLSDLDSAYVAFHKSNPEMPFIVPLNESEGRAFYGKATASLYTTLHTAITRKNLKETWRLVRVKKSEDTFLRIVRL